MSVSDAVNKVLVSDLGQVILPFDTARVWSALLPLSRLPEAATRSTVQQIVRETGLGRGGVTGAEFHRRVAAETGIDLDYAGFRSAWSDMFELNHGVLRLIRETSCARRVLLSNTNALHWEFITQRFPEILEPFDDLCVSHEIGCEKPDPEIYAWVERLTNAAPQEHLFVDDIPVYVEAARSRGWDAVLFTGARMFANDLRTRGFLVTDDDFGDACVRVTESSQALWDTGPGR